MSDLYILRSRSIKISQTGFTDKVDDARTSLSILRAKEDVVEDIAHIRHAIKRQKLQDSNPKELFLGIVNRGALSAGIFLSFTNLSENYLEATQLTTSKLYSYALLIGSFLGKRFGRKSLHHIVFLSEPVYLHLDKELPSKEVRRFI
nr:unnamed protein product [Callosobruchus chinensis]